MNYYEHHLGDYAEATGHLTFVEDAAYSRLMRKVYATEFPLPSDIKAVQRLVGARSKEERDAVAVVLNEFFVLQEDGWHNVRCDAEIADYQKKVLHNRSVGKLGGRPKKSETQVVPKQEPNNNPVGSKTEPKRNPNVTLPSPQSPDTSSVAEATADKSASELTKSELWKAGKSLLEEQKMPKAQCGLFVGKLVKDYGDQIVIDAVRAAVVTQPADAASYLKATCQHAAGQRQHPNKQEALEERNRKVADAWANKGEEIETV